MVITYPMDLRERVVAALEEGVAIAKGGSTVRALALRINFLTLDHIGMIGHRSGAYGGSNTNPE
jgi:hypothetical protein